MVSHAFGEQTILTIMEWLSGTGGAARGQGLRGHSGPPALPRVLLHLHARGGAPFNLSAPQPFYFQPLSTPQHRSAPRPETLARSFLLLPGELLECVSLIMQFLLLLLWTRFLFEFPHVFENWIVGQLVPTIGIVGTS